MNNKWGIANPPSIEVKPFLTADYKSAGTPNGRNPKKWLELALI